VEDKYIDEKHTFSFNRELLYSFDVCGNCEAHAILFSIDENSNNSNRISSSIESSMKSKIENSPTLMKIDPELLKNNINFKKCPFQVD
jgi:hypothetical protein